MEDNIDKRITKSINYLMYLWSLPEEDGHPIQFIDNLAYIFFCSSIHSLCKKYYVLGKKHQQKKVKQKAVERFKKRILDDEFWRWN